MSTPSIERHASRSSLQDALALGLAARGIAWDSWHHGSHYIASWYAIACLIIDIGLAAYVVLQRDRYLLVTRTRRAR